MRSGTLVQGIFAKIGPDLELRGGDLISSPVDGIVSLVSPKKVTDPSHREFISSSYLMGYCNP